MRLDCWQLSSIVIVNVVSGNFRASSNITDRRVSRRGLPIGVAGSYILASNASNTIEFDMPAYPRLYPSFPVAS